MSFSTSLTSFIFWPFNLYLWLFRMPPPTNAPDDKHRFIHPTPTDLRSPCPFMNSMANHGYINRDGRGLTFYSLVKCQMDVFNFSFLLAAVLSLGGLFLCGNGFTVDLAQLRKHNAIEHDASLGRQDLSTGDSWTIDPELVEKLILESSSPKGLSFQDIARVRVAREATLPAPGLDKLHIGVAERESCLAIAQLGKGSPEDPKKRIIPQDYLRSFFLNEMFPIGWKRPEHELGFFETKDMSAALGAEMNSYRATFKSK